jgi:hypothetical protein
MIGTVLMRSPQVDGPYPAAGIARRSFARTEIASFGKLKRHGDFVVRYIIRLADGTELFVRAGDQPAADRAWLVKLAREVKFTSFTSRDVPCVIAWHSKSQEAR